MPDYYAYRYLRVKPLTLDFYDDDNDLNVNDMIDQLKKGRMDIEYNGRIHVLYHVEDRTDDIVVLQMGRFKFIEKHELGATQIESILEEDFPWIYIILDIKKQILLIQKNTSIFHDINQTKLVFGAFLRKWMSETNYEVAINEITSTNEFWRIVDTHEKIYGLEIVIDGPNLFEGWFESSKLIEILKKIYNSSESKFVLLNAKGGLKIMRKFIEDLIKMISHGAGSFKIKILEKGKQVWKSSKIWIRNFSIEKDLDEESTERLEEIFEDLHRSKDS